MKLFVGLGNPGKKYAKNRHNLGFMAIDEIAAKLKAPEFIEKFGGLYTRVTHSAFNAESKKDPASSAGCEEVVLFKPLSFMNNSGIPVSDLANFYKININDVYVFYDELDIELGKIKIKNGGGDGGHNGIKSLDAHLGKAFWRVRLGIGHPGHKDLVHGYVLSDFTNEEKKLAEDTCKKVAEHIGLIKEGNRELFLTKFFEEKKED